MELMADSLNFGNQRSMDNGLLGLGCAYVTRTRTVDTTFNLRFITCGRALFAYTCMFLRADMLTSVSVQFHASVSQFIICRHALLINVCVMREKIMKKSIAANTRSIFARCMRDRNSLHGKCRYTIEHSHMFRRET